MKIYELKQGSEIVIEITFGTETHEFNSMVLEIKDNFIVAAPIRVDDKVVSFAKASVPVNLIWKRDGKSPIIWNQVAVTVVSYKKNTVYKIQQSMEGKEVNRRSSYRLYVGLDGIAQVGANRKTLSVLVKDISEGGFAFIADEDVNQEGESLSVRLTFIDNEKSIIINGIVVRKVQLSENRFLYGCIINLKTPLIAQYISLKQRERIAKQRDVVLVGGTRAGVSRNKPKSKEDKAEAFVDDDKVRINRQRYDKDIFSDKKDTTRINRERYRNLKF